MEDICFDGNKDYLGNNSVYGGNDVYSNPSEQNIPSRNKNPRNYQEQNKRANSVQPLSCKIPHKTSDNIPLFRKQDLLKK